MSLDPARTRGERPLRVVHCPINVAGVPWANVQALRELGVDARLVVFNVAKLHPYADVVIRRPRNSLIRAQAVQWPAFARLLPSTDIFHFYFGVTLIPKRFQFPILRALRKKSLFHYMGSDIRGKTPEELAYGRRAGAQIVGSYDAIRWVPEADVVLPGIDLTRYTPVPASDRARPVVVHAPSNRLKKGTDHVIAACADLDVDLDIVEGLPHDEARRRYEAADIIVDQLNVGWYGLFAIESMALGKPVLTYLHEEARRRTEETFGLRIPIVATTKEALRETLRPLVASAAERRRIGAESRAYVEQLHDVRRNATQLLEIYRRLA